MASEVQGSMAERVSTYVSVFVQYAEQKDFVWRLARAHSDMCEITGDADEKRSYAAEGEESCWRRGGQR